MYHNQSVHLTLITFIAKLIFVNGKSLESSEEAKYRYSVHSLEDITRQVVQLNINSPVFLHESVEFICKYTINEHRLYSIKWYRNDKEFFRYVPHEVPQVQHFNLKGITLANPVAYELEEGVFRLYLTRASMETQGVYRCEISTDSPTFAIYKDYKQLNVYVLPSKSPRISGSKSSFLLKSRIDLNCTSPKSNPVSTLQWFINEKLAPSDYLINYPTLNHSDGLQTKTLRLKFIVNDEYFEFGNMKLKCVALYKKLSLGANETLIRSRSKFSRKKPTMSIITKSSKDSSNRCLERMTTTIFLIVLSSMV